MAEDEKGGMTVQEAGRKGGTKVRDEGLVDYQELGTKGGATTYKRHGVEHYREIGQRGGHATSEKHGSGHYAKIGSKGGARVRSLIAAAKAAEARGE